MRVIFLAATMLCLMGMAAQAQPAKMNPDGSGPTELTGALRDVVSFFRRESKDDAGVANPIVPERLLGIGRGVLRHPPQFGQGPVIRRLLPGESLTIAGWVAMWRPLEIFLYHVSVLEPPGFHSQWERLEALRRSGFPVNPRSARAGARSR